MTLNITKTEIRYLIKTILTFTFINYAANLFGLWISKALNESIYEYPENILNEFALPILVQSLMFGICFAVAYYFLKKKNLAQYTFAAFQFIVFHFIFLLNLKISHGLHFVSSFSNIGLKYLTYCGQYLVDVLYIYFPINGNFQEGMFAPDKIGTFYIHWILLNILYYAAIGWLAVVTAKHFFNETIQTKEEEIQR